MVTDCDLTLRQSEDQDQLLEAQAASCDKPRAASRSAIYIEEVWCEFEVVCGLEERAGAWTGYLVKNAGKNAEMQNSRSSIS